MFTLLCIGVGDSFLGHVCVCVWIINLVANAICRVVCLEVGCLLVVQHIWLSKNSITWHIKRVVQPFVASDRHMPHAADSPLPLSLLATPWPLESKNLTMSQVNLHNLNSVRLSHWLCVCVCVCVRATPQVINSIWLTNTLAFIQTHTR